MPRPNRGHHLWRNPRNGIYHARFFANGKACTSSLGTDDIDEAKKKLANFVPGERRRQSVDFGCIYVIAWSPDGPVKIGKTRSLQMRVFDLQCGCPYKLRVMHHGQRHLSRLSFIETHIHRLLAHKKLQGEWFEISVGEAAKTIRKAEAELDIEQEHQQALM